MQADNLEKLTLEFKTNFLPALNNLVAYLKKVVVSVENSYKEAKKYIYKFYLKKIKLMKFLIKNY